MLDIIANTESGSGMGGKILPGVQDLLSSRGISFRTRITQSAGHAIRLAADAMTEGTDGIVCIGGDGTVFEIINGLNGRSADIYFVPAGTGNDFVKMLNLPNDPIEALKVQLDGSPRRIDVGRVNELYFLNISGTGFDVEVLRQASRFKKIGKGILPYFLGILAALRKFRPLSIELTVDGKTEKREVTIISVGNGRYFGGGMKAVPDALIDDGLFDVVIADRMSRLMILRLLARFISGKHTSLPMVRVLRCTEVTIRSSGMTVNMDGELRQMNEAEYKILPGLLTIRLP